MVSCHGSWRPSSRTAISACWTSSEWHLTHTKNNQGHKYHKHHIRSETTIHPFPSLYAKAKQIPQAAAAMPKCMSKNNRQPASSPPCIPPPIHPSIQAGRRAGSSIGMSVSYKYRASEQESKRGSVQSQSRARARERSENEKKMPFHACPCIRRAPHALPRFPFIH